MSFLGRPPTSYIHNITKISGLNIHDVVHRCQDRDERRIATSSTAAANMEHDDANG